MGTNAKRNVDVARQNRAVTNLNTRIGTNQSSNVTLEDSSLQSKYAELQNSEALNSGTRTITGNSNNSAAMHDDVKSDLEYVTQNMNTLRNHINGTRFVSSLKEAEFKRNDKYQETMNKCLNKYFDVSGKLLDIIAREASATISYAQVMEDMDKDISKRVGDL